MGFCHASEKGRELISTNGGGRGGGGRSGGGSTDLMDYSFTVLLHCYLFAQDRTTFIGALCYLCL